MRAIIALALSAVFVAATATAGTVNVFYEVRTGEVTIESDVEIARFFLGNVPFIKENFINPLPIDNETIFEVRQDNWLGTYDLTGNTYDIDGVSLGFILEPGIKRPSIRDSKNQFIPINLQFWRPFEGASYFENQIFSEPQTNSVETNFTYVPEPTSLALLGLGGLMMIRRRR